MQARSSLLFVLGTRPEAIKLFPVIREARRRPQLSVRLFATGQHREMLTPFLDLFDLRPDANLDILEEGQSTSMALARIIERLSPVLRADPPARVVVQGDTMSTLGAALAAFHSGIPVAHVEAGLRTWDLRAPFPEEANRRLVTRLSDLHFAPTEGARDNLLRDGVAVGRIHLTGNPVIDALAIVQPRLDEIQLQARYPILGAGMRLILATGHRRENLGRALEDTCRVLGDLVEARPDVVLVFPVHRNPAVRRSVERILGPRLATGRVFLDQPLDYLTFLALLRRAQMVVTDSGGIQEEAPYFGTQVLCTRTSTERPEGVASGLVRLVGTHPATLRRVADQILDGPVPPGGPRTAPTLYGDGRASQRIVDVLVASLAEGQAAATAGREA